jgi:hypothetical protein
VNRSPLGHGKPYKFKRAHNAVVLSRRVEEAGISFRTRLQNWSSKVKKRQEPTLEVQNCQRRLLVDTFIPDLGSYNSHLPSPSGPCFGRAVQRTPPPTSRVSSCSASESHLSHLFTFSCPMTSQASSQLSGKTSNAHSFQSMRHGSYIVK